MIELRDFAVASPSNYVDLLNDPWVRKHMPLSSEVDEKWCEEWIKAKRTQWDESGELGPWSIWINEEFVGWGGLQPDDEYESGLALVISKRFSGQGQQVLVKILEKAIELDMVRQMLVEFPLPQRSLHAEKTRF